MCLGRDIVDELQRGRTGGVVLQRREPSLAKVAEGSSPRSVRRSYQEAPACA
jgi:hypothetical protein